MSDQQTAELPSARDPVEELAEDFLERYRRGERPAISEFAARAPEHADEIRELFPALIVMELRSPAALAPAAASPPAVPLQRLGDYRILREVGRGGMGIVYAADHEALGRQVALKVLLPTSAGDSRCLLRFRREARAAARLHHTNIVPVFDIGQREGWHYYAMQLIHGQGLDAVIAELRRLRGSPAEGTGSPTSGAAIGLAGSVLAGQFCGEEPAAGPAPASRPCAAGAPGPSPTSSIGREGDGGGPSSAPHDDSGFSSRSDLSFYRSVARLGLQVAGALAYAHGQRVLHRDIKPSNLLLDTSGTVWVTDFGLAKEQGEDLTRTGDVVGTLRYLAPERLSGTSDARSDLYSLGLTLYELLTLRPAFRQPDRARLVHAIAHEEPPPPRQLDPHMPRDLETIVLKAITKEPAGRYPTAEALEEDLRRFLTDRPIHARRSTVWERTWRWCRRNPALAGLMAALTLTFLAGFAGVAWKWREAEQAREAEGLARKEADDRALEIEQGLEGLKAANALLDRGRWYIGEHRWDDAHAAFTKAIQRRPDHVSVWVERGDLYTRLGLWNLAAADYAREMELREPDTTLRWYQCALLRFSVGDVEGYRQACRTMRQRFAGSLYIPFAEEVVRAQLLSPGPDADLQELVALIEKVVATQPWSAYSLYILGTAHYRAGQYEPAIRRLGEAPAVTDWGVRFLSHSVLAMAYHRRGQAAQAREALDRAAQVLDQWTRERYESHQERWSLPRGAKAVWPVAWWDYLECQLYYREAKVLIDGSPPPDDARLHVLRARAFFGLRWLRKAQPEYDAALKLSPQDPQIRLEGLHNRAYYLAHLGHWTAVAAELAKARELRPDDPYLWRFRTLAQFAAEDRDAYRQACLAMLDRFEKTQDPLTAGHVLLACVLRDDALPDMTRLLPLTRVADTVWHWGTWGRGAALYRAGRYEDAVRCLETAAKTYQPRAWDWCFRAMAHYRLGHTEEARRCVAEAQRWIEEANRAEVEDLTGARPTWGDWHEPVIYPLLLREAEALIEGKSSHRLPAE